MAAKHHDSRIDRVITRWIKRHLSRLGADINLQQLNSLVEDKDMLAENLENLVRKERQDGIELGIQKGIEKGIEQGIVRGRMETIRKTALTLIAMNALTDDQIAQASGLTVAEIQELRADTKH